MFIKDIFKSKKNLISFEVFPPKPTSPIEGIYKTIDELSILKPDFISVTYGAGGSTTGKTIEISSLIKNKYGIESLAHLTCLNSTRDEINLILDKLKENNVSNILALRGDLPNDKNIKTPIPYHYEYANDLINHIKLEDNFCVAAACYPEGHTECTSKKEDLIHLKNKIEKGTDFLISQLFFDNNYFYDFMDKLASFNITIPVCAGIMPVINKNQIERICALSGATLTTKFKKIVDKYEFNKEALKEAGIAYATEQIIDLLSSGVDGIHLYTMNKPDVAKKIVSNISYIRETL